MSFSYSPSLTNLSDHARLALNDTVQQTSFFPDETINAKIASFGYLEGVAQLAEARRLAIASSPDSYDEGSGGLKLVWKARDAALKELIDNLRNGLVAPPDDESNRPGASVGRPHLRREHMRGYRPS